MRGFGRRAGFGAFVLSVQKFLRGRGGVMGAQGGGKASCRGGYEWQERGKGSRRHLHGLPVSGWISSAAVIGRCVALKPLRRQCPIQAIDRRAILLHDAVDLEAVVLLERFDAVDHGLVGVGGEAEIGNFQVAQIGQRFFWCLANRPDPWCRHCRWFSLV